MQKQLGACAFSAACVMPGPRHRLEGTNREFCELHFHQVETSLAATPRDNDFARAVMAAPRSARQRSQWLRGYVEQF